MNQTIEIDATTYEVVEDGASSRRKSPLPPFVMVFQGALDKAARDKVLRGESLRVLCYLVSKTRVGNGCAVTSQAQIGKALGLKQQGVSRAITQLLRRNVILRGGRIGAGHLYRLNPRFGLYGNGNGYQKAISEAPALL
jgi:hypothetical protein